MLYSDRYSSNTDACQPKTILFGTALFSLLSYDGDVVPCKTDSYIDIVTSRDF